MTSKIANYFNRGWRRGRDSNPRRACTLNGFQDNQVIVLDSRQAWPGLGFACGAARVRSWRRKRSALKRLGEARALQRVLRPRAKREAALRPWALMAMAAVASAAAPDLAASATAMARQAMRVSSLAGLVRWVASR